MNAITKTTVADQVERLEVFEANLKLTARVQELEAQLRDRERQHVDEISGLKHTTKDPVAAAIDMLHQHPRLVAQVNALQRQLEQQQAEIAQAEQDKTRLDEELELAVAAAVKARNEATHFEDQCRQMLEKNNANVDKANVTITKLQAEVRALKSENQQMRALNPERQQKQIKNLQSKNKELQEAVTTLRKQAADAGKLRKDKEKLVAINERLTLDNRRLDLALAESCSDLVNANRIPPIEELGDWAIYADERGPDVMIVLDKTTDIARPHHITDGLVKARQIPKGVMERVNYWHEEGHRRRALEINYAQGETVEQRLAN